MKSSVKLPKIETKKTAKEQLDVKFITINGVSVY